MKKDFNKICIRTIMTYFIIVTIVCLLRIDGLNYFSMNFDSKILNKFSKFISSYNLENIWYSITLYFYTYMILSISCKDNSRKMKIYSLIVTAIGIPYKIFTSKIEMVWMRPILEILFLVVVFNFYNSNNKKKNRNILLSLILNSMFQLPVSYCKNVNVINLNSFITNVIFDIDYITINLLFYYYYFGRKEVIDLWEMVVGYLLDLWHGFMQLPDLFLESSRHLIYGIKKQKDIIKKVLKSKRKEKIDNIAFMSIYYILTLFWNLFTVYLIVYIASINNMSITIIFILVSFLINKGKFGKALHLKSAFYCFIVSNISYYFISRLTLPIGVSYLVPILLGVLLSYFTALIVKYTTKELYKGMNEKELREICKIKRLEEYKTEFLVDFYCKEMNYVQLHMKYRYSQDRLRHMKMEYLKEFKNS